MGVNLVSITGQKRYFKSDAWLALCKLARIYDWEPIGTSSPKNWTGGSWNANDYFSDSGQSVHSLDALEFSNAIERAIPDLPDQSDNGDEYQAYVNYSDSLSEIINDFENDFLGVKPFSVFQFTTDLLNSLEDFVAFCRMGEFWIY